MSKLLQLRGGTTSEHATFTGALREVTVDTTKDTLVVHDGTTAGGHPLSTPSDVATALATLVDSAPATLNTLNELSAALGDDANYATTMATSLGTKVTKTTNQALSTAANAMTISGHTITLNRGDGTTDTVVVPDNNTDTNTTYTASTGMSLSGTAFSCTINTPTEVGLSNLSSNGNYVSGSFTASGNITAYSDLRLKSNIETIPSALEKVTSVRGVTFDMNGERATGVIAQELEAVLPEAVYDNEGGMKSVAYGNIVGLLIEAIKELDDKVKMLGGK